MNSWTYALDKKALKMGVLKLPDMFFTCPGCKRKVGREEGLSIRTTALCSICTEMEKRKASGVTPRTNGRFRAVHAWFIPGLR